MSHDYRATAYELAGPGHEKHVDAACQRLHYNESLHMHDLGETETQHGACAYCWLRAGRAVRALVDAGLVTTTPTAEAPVEPAPACRRCETPFDRSNAPFAFGDTAFARHDDTPWCRACVDNCHDGGADHRCAVCHDYKAAS